MPPEVPGIRASFPMRHKCNGKFAAFLFWAGAPPDDHRAVVRHETVASVALDHENGFRVNGHIPARRGLYPLNLRTAPPAKAHTAHPLSA